MRSVLSAALIFVAVATISAHHTASYIYDIDRPVLLQGMVSEVEWKNPHVLLHLDVKENDGVTISWLLEARAVSIMRRMGMEQDFIQSGKSAEVTVCAARDGSHEAGLQSLNQSGVTTWVGECAN